jgi:hypothetical protein
MDIVQMIRNPRERIREIVVQSNAAMGSVTNIRALKCAKIALTAGLVNTIAFAWQNPESNKILITRVIVDITTGGGTGGCEFDIGPATTATGTSATIFSNLLINNTGVYDHLLVSGTGLGGVTKVDENGGTTPWITGKILVQAASNLVGNVYIFYTEI